MTGTDGARLAAAFDISAIAAGFAEDPFPVYRALLEHAPVKHFADGSVMLSRWADLDRVYRDTATFSSDKKVEFRPKFGDSPLYEHHTTSLVFSDPPLHTRVRKIMVGALNPKALAAMEPGLVRLIDRLVDDLAEKGDVDLVEDFASRIPVEVIGNLFDMPHEERGPLRDWSLAILGALEPVLSVDQLASGNRAVTEFKAYMKDLVRRRTARPGNPDTDVLTRLIEGIGGENLSEVELLQNCIFILNAGHETTTNLIGNALHLLHEWPGERARLIADPAMIHTAVDEFLRFQSPNQLGNRMSTADAEFHGETIPAGTRIHLAIGVLAELAERCRSGLEFRAGGRDVFQRDVRLIDQAFIGSDLGGDGLDIAQRVGEGFDVFIRQEGVDAFDRVIRLAEHLRAAGKELVELGLLRLDHGHGLSGFRLQQAGRR